MSLPTLVFVTYKPVRAVCLREGLIGFFWGKFPLHHFLCRLEITVASCDVVLRPGTERAVMVEARWKNWWLIVEEWLLQGWKYRHKIWKLVGSHRLPGAYSCWFLRDIVRCCTPFFLLWNISRMFDRFVQVGWKVPTKHWGAGTQNVMPMKQLRWWWKRYPNLYLLPSPWEGINFSKFFSSSLSDKACFQAAGFSELSIIVNGICLVIDLGVSLNGLPPFHTPNWSFLVGKPMVVGYHHFRKPPFRYYMNLHRFLEIHHHEFEEFEGLRPRLVISDPHTPKSWI